MGVARAAPHQHATEANKVMQWGCSTVSALASHGGEVAAWRMTEIHDTTGAVVGVLRIHAHPRGDLEVAQQAVSALINLVLLNRGSDEFSLAARRAIRLGVTDILPIVLTSHSDVSPPQKFEDLQSSVARLQDLLSQPREPPPPPAAAATTTFANSMLAQDMAEPELVKGSQHDDQALPVGTVVVVDGRRGKYERFSKNRVGANDHTVRFDDGSTETLKLKKRSWYFSPTGATTPEPAECELQGSDDCRDTDLVACPHCAKRWCRPCLSQLALHSNPLRLQLPCPFCQGDVKGLAREHCPEALEQTSPRAVHPTAPPENPYFVEEDSPPVPPPDPA